MRILKYKKQIVIMCLFTMLFTTSFRKVEEPKADILVSGSILLLMGALLTGTGCIFANSSQLTDASTILFEKVKDQIQIKDKQYYIDKSLDVVMSALDTMKYINSLGNSEVSLSYYPVEGAFSSSHHLANIQSGFLPIKDIFNLTCLLSDGISYNRSVAFIATENTTNVYTASELCPNACSGKNFSIGTLKEGLTYKINSVCTSHGSKTLFTSNNFATKVRFGFYGNYVKSGYSNLVDIFTYGESVCPTVDKEYEDKYLGDDVIGGSVSIPINPSIGGYDEKVTSPTWTGSISYPYNPSDAGVEEKPKENDTDKPVVGVPDIPLVPDIDFPSTGTDWLDSLINVLEGMLNGLIGAINTVIEWLWNLLKYLLEALKELLIFLFVPSEGLFTDNFNGWKSDLESKFGINLGLINDLQNVGESGVKDIRFVIMGVSVVLPISVVNNIANVSRTIATGLVVIFMVWYVYRNAYKLIRGVDPVIGDNSGGGSK